jgi:serine phosphatase RsbU (regulator of sigma subunit)
MTESEQRYALMCMEVWGGNRGVTRTVDLLDLTAWVYSNPVDGHGSGGDVHFLSVCGNAVLSRVVLADVSGHGTQVTGPAQVLHEMIREHINTWDQTDFVRDLNKTFRGSAASEKYATAAVFGILRETGETAFTNAGHPPPLWYRSKSSTWTWLDEEACAESCRVTGLPVGLIPGTDYRQSLIEFEPDDMLVLYTDGVTEAEDAAGEALGGDRLLEWLRRGPVDSPVVVGQYLVGELNTFRGSHRVDDETIIVVHRGVAAV